jgi:hypothetical protein
MVESLYIYIHNTNFILFLKKYKYQVQDTFEKRLKIFATCFVNVKMSTYFHGI